MVIVGLVVAFLAGIAFLAPSNPCATGTKGAREVCELQGKNAAIYDDQYVYGTWKANGEPMR